VYEKCIGKMLMKTNPFMQSTSKNSHKLEWSQKSRFSRQPK